jgi:hypothetical protein
MIVTRLQGGLGNQMFQFAFAYILSRKNIDSIIYYDDRQLANNDNTFLDNGIVRRKFALNHFCLNIQKWDSSQDSIFFPTNLFDRSLKKLRQIFGKTSLLFEETASYNHSILKRAKGDIYCVGYWQAEPYYTNYRHELRQLFSFERIISESIEKIQSSIKSAFKGSVSVHVRRGDYLAKAAADIHPVCTQEYYDYAITTMEASVDNVNCYFIFSDDIDWCKQNLSFKKLVYFVSEDKSIGDVGELYLMTLCEHHIIANSSFSWWGAYLGSDSGFVVYPKRWFKPYTMNQQIQTLFPPSWIGI